MPGRLGFEHRCSLHRVPKEHRSYVPDQRSRSSRRSNGGADSAGRAPERRSVLLLESLAASGKTCVNQTLADLCPAAAPHALKRCAVCKP